MEIQRLYNEILQLEGKLSYLKTLEKKLSDEKKEILVEIEKLGLDKNNLKNFNIESEFAQLKAEIDEIEKEIS